MNDLINEKINLNAQKVELQRLIAIQQMQLQKVENGISRIDRTIEDIVQARVYLLSVNDGNIELEYSLRKELQSGEIPDSTKNVLNITNRVTIR